MSTATYPYDCVYATFDTPAGADEALDRLKKAEKNWSINIENAAVIRTDASGASSFSETEVTLEENTLLHLNLNGRTLVERTTEDDLELGAFSDPFGSESNAGLVNLKKAIAEAKTNEKIKGIYLETGLINAGQAGLLELREESCRAD